MIERRVTRVVPLPAAEVWARLVDQEAMTQWVRGMTVRIDETGRRSADGVGLVRHLGLGPGPDIVEEIVEVSPPHVLGYRALSGVPLKDYTGSVRVREQGPSSTQVEWTLSATRRVPVVESLLLAVIVRVVLGAFVGSLGRARPDTTTAEDPAPTG